MRRIRTALLYTALVTLANAGAAQSPADLAPTDLEALREGDMRKLTVHADPVAVPEVQFESETGETMGLDAYEGQHVILNFWATWCAPCRREMPQLSELQEEFGGEEFQVVTVATGRNSPGAMERFFDEIGVGNLPLHRDPQLQFARGMGVLGLPVTVVLDPEGQEIARMQGDADWASDSARAIVSALIADES